MIDCHMYVTGQIEGFVSWTNCLQQVDQREIIKLTGVAD